MGSSVYTIIRSKSYSAYHKKILDVVKEKFNLNNAEIILILDLIFFFIRKELLENKKFLILSFGKLYIRELKRENKLEFKNSKHIVPVVNKTKKKIDFDIEKGKRIDAYDRVFMGVSKCLNTQYRVALAIFNLTIYVITEELLKDNVMYLRKFGFFYLYRVKYTADQFGKLFEEPRIRTRIRFKPCAKFYREINCVKDEIDVNRRITNLLKISGVSKKITGIKKIATIKRNYYFTKRITGKKTKIKSIRNSEKEKK